MGREGGGARGVEAHVDARSEIRLDVEGGGGDCMCVVVFLSSISEIWGCLVGAVVRKLAREVGAGRRGGGLVGWRCC